MEAWIFDEDDTCDRPFAFVKEVFRKRLLLQGLAPDNPSRIAEIAFKWALAAIYGQLARAVGWDQKRKLPPPTHQIEWAGYILSHCRADMYRLAIQAGDDLISIDTDSVTCMREIHGLPMGKQLGEWKVTEADEGVFFQSGIYFTRNSGEKWEKGKQRGVQKRAKTPEITAEMLIEAIEEDKNVQLTPKRKYVTVKMALNGQYTHVGEWLDHPGNILSFGGGGKRYHNRKMCPRYCRSDIGVHCFIPAPVDLGSPLERLSVPHRLPWKDGPREAVGENQGFKDTLWFREESIEDEGWIAELIANYPEKVRKFER